MRDRLFLLSVLTYLLNRWIFEPTFSAPFFRSYVNDLVCIPFWVPVMVWMLRKLGLRPDDAAPRAHEIMIPLLLWSAMFEVWLPATDAYREVAVADPADVLCYATGALVASVVWRVQYR